LPFDNFPRPLTPIRPSPVASTAGYLPGSYAGRQSRFDARSQRRYGDWSVLGVPAVLLWLEDAVDPNVDPNCDNGICGLNY
jgi:hypothetical protein